MQSLGGYSSYTMRGRLCKGNAHFFPVCSIVTPVMNMITDLCGHGHE